MSLPEISRKSLALLSKSSKGNQNEEAEVTTNASAMTKKTKTPHDYETKCFNVNDFQILSKKKLPKYLYEYLASGTDDEQTLFENRSAFKRWFLRPRVMRPVGKLSTRTNLFGNNVSMPIFCTPAGVHALCDEGGECSTVRACKQAGILFGLSQHSTRSIEDVAAAAGDDSLLFYQAYILKDRNVTLRLVRRAVRAGYKGIFVTVDSVRFGFREADARNGFNSLPPPHRLVNYDDVGTSEKKLEQTYNSNEESAWDQNTEQMFEQDVTWDDIKWIKSEVPDLPVIVKGIMTAEDAELAIASGADAVMVSNHGGRQLDGALSSIDVLPEVVHQVNGRVPVWLDGGVRRGTDVLKALALGASAVGIGKPIFFSLAIGGQDAVSYMLHLLRTELEAAMAICGIESIKDISPNLVTRLPNCTTSPYMRSSL